MYFLARTQNAAELREKFRVAGYSSDHITNLMLLVPYIISTIVVFIEQLTPLSMREITTAFSN